MNAATPQGTGIQRGVTALVIEEHLNVLEYSRPRLHARGEVGVVDQLLLERGEKAIHRRVVLAIVYK